MLDISSKEKALLFLKKLISQNNNLLELKKEASHKLSDIHDLEKDFEIGLKLTPSQETLLSNKQFYQKLGKILTKLTEDTDMVDDIDETIKVCVENVFLERKSKPVEIVEKEVVEVVKVEEKKIEEVKPGKHHEPERLYDGIDHKDMRVPFAWKNGLVFNTVRERQRDSEKNKHIPTKEYRAGGMKKV